MYGGRCLGVLAISRSLKEPRKTEGTLGLFHYHIFLRILSKRRKKYAREGRNKNLR